MPYSCNLQAVRHKGAGRHTVGLGKVLLYRPTEFESTAHTTSQGRTPQLFIDKCLLHDNKMKAKQNTPSEYRNEAHYKQQVQEIILRNTKEDITIDLRDSSTIRLLGLSGSSIGSARLYPPSIKKGTLRGKFASSFTRLHSF